MLLLRKFAKTTLRFARPSVSPRFALHQYEFYVILDNRIGFVRLAKKPRPVLNLVRGVGDFVPNDGIQIVEPYLSTKHCYVPM